MFRLNGNKQKTRPNSLKESIFGYLSENFGLFRFVTKQFCLFRLFRYRFETPKQTEIFLFLVSRNKPEKDLVSFCFGSNRNYFCLFRGTPYRQPSRPPSHRTCSPDQNCQSSKICAGKKILFSLKTGEKFTVLFDANLFFILRHVFLTGIVTFHNSVSAIQGSGLN
jgi:hypothetical protein